MFQHYKHYSLIVDYAAIRFDEKRIDRYMYVVSHVDVYNSDEVKRLLVFYYYALMINGIIYRFVNVMLLVLLIIIAFICVWLVLF